MFINDITTQFLNQAFNTNMHTRRISFTQSAFLYSVIPTVADCIISLVIIPLNPGEGTGTHSRHLIFVTFE